MSEEEHIEQESGEHSNMIAGADRVAVIGAGMAGCATAKALRCRGIDCVVFEKQARVGGLWVDNYYGTSVQAPKELYEYPEKAFSEGTSKFPSKEEVCQYLEEFLDEWNLRAHFRFQVEVTEISKDHSSPNGAWIVKSRDLRTGASQTELFGYVIVCNGLCSNKPKRIEFPGQDTFTGRIVHSSEWRSPDEFANKRVMVVGNGKSAADACMCARKCAKSTVQVAREKHWYLPRYVAGFIPYKFIVHNRALGLVSAQYYKKPTALTETFHKLAGPLKYVFWRAIEQVLLAQYRFPEHLLPSKRLDEDVAPFIASTEFLSALRNGEFDFKSASVERLDGDQAVLSDGSSVGVDVIVQATGWETGVSIVDETTMQKLNMGADGMYLYQNIIPPNVDGLAFVGSNCLTPMNPLTHSIQAAWVASLLCGEHALPSKEEMSADVALMKEARSGVHFSPVRGAVVELHVLQYHDDLLRSMNVNPLRGGMFGWLADYILPVEPSSLSYAVRPRNTLAPADKVPKEDTTFEHQKNVYGRPDDLELAALRSVTFRGLAA